MTGHPKPVDEREQRRRRLHNLDVQGTTAAKKRCRNEGGLCEAMFVVEVSEAVEVITLADTTQVRTYRVTGICGHPARECHHMRGRHRDETDQWYSAEAKQMLCTKCHDWATPHRLGGLKLRLVQAGALPCWSDKYVRVG